MAVPTVETKRLQIISEAVEEFEATLVSEKRPDVTLKLDKLLKMPGTNKLQGVITRLTQMNIPLFLYHEWNQIAGQPQQPAGERDSPILTVYHFVEEKLDRCTGIPQDPEHGQVACDTTNSTYKLIVWSAELWFFQQIEGIRGGDIEAWISTVGTKKLFKKYFDPIDEDDHRFAVVSEADACGLLEQLLTTKSMSSKLEEVLKNWKAVHDLITRGSMSKEMARIYSESSERFYIIPSPTDKWKMYGMHFYLTNYFEMNEDYSYKLDDKDEKIPDARAIKDAQEEAKCMRKAMKACNFTLRGPPLDEFNPEEGSFDKLEDWLTKKLLRIKEKCSMLFISFSVHGKRGQLMDTCDQFREIEEILKLIHDDARLLELKDIPKVVVIQACQHTPANELHRENEFIDISKRLKEFVTEKAQNLLLLMAVEQGEYSVFNYGQSYLFKFARAMTEEKHHLDPPTMRGVHRHAHKDHEDDQKADKTENKSKKYKEVILQTTATATPDAERAHVKRYSEDDGYDLLSNSERDDESSEDENEPVEDNTDY